MSTTETRSTQAHTMYQVCWKSATGEGGGRGQPVPRNVADFMVHDESLANPLRHFWVEGYRPKARSNARPDA